jgi:hypothetical protein
MDALSKQMPELSVGSSSLFDLSGCAPRSRANQLSASGLIVLKGTIMGRHCLFLRPLPRGCLALYLLLTAATTMATESGPIVAVSGGRIQGEPLAKLLAATKGLQFNLGADGIRVELEK